MKPGDCINIPAGVKHWHGAAPDSWFSHLAIEVPGENGSNEWLEALDDEQYGKLKQDKGMFTVDDNLKVVVHPEVESDYLKQYNNKSLYIPENAFFRPDINNLRYHQRHILGLFKTAGSLVKAAGYYGNATATLDMVAEGKTRYRTNSNN